MMNSTEKDRLILKARKLGSDYFRKYSGCAQTTLYAVADTLNIEISDEVFKAVAPLSSFTGGCGAMCGAAVVFGLKYGKDLDTYLEEPDLGIVKYLIYDIQCRLEDKYSGFLCWEIQSQLYGRSFDLRKPEDMEAFGSRIDEIYTKCGKMIEDVAGWVVKAILEQEHPELAP
jgi:hypothetical protein